MKRDFKKFNNPRDEHAPRERKERPPLEWKSATSVVSGNVRAEITEAQADGRKLYSIVFSRMIDDKGSKFFRPTDLHHIEDVVRQARNWLDSEQSGRIQEVPL